MKIPTLNKVQHIIWKIVEVHSIWPILIKFIEVLLHRLYLVSKRVFSSSKYFWILAFWRIFYYCFILFKLHKKRNCCIEQNEIVLIYWLIGLIIAGIISVLFFLHYFSPKRFLPSWTPKVCFLSSNTLILLYKQRFISNRQYKKITWTIAYKTEWV